MKTNPKMLHILLHLGLVATFCSAYGRYPLDRSARDTRLQYNSLDLQHRNGDGTPPFGPPLPYPNRHFNPPDAPEFSGDSPPRSFPHHFHHPRFHPNDYYYLDLPDRSPPPPPPPPPPPRRRRPKTNINFLQIVVDNQNRARPPSSCGGPCSQHSHCSAECGKCKYHPHHQEYICLPNYPVYYYTYEPPNSEPP